MTSAQEFQEYARSVGWVVFRLLLACVILTIVGVVLIVRNWIKNILQDQDLTRKIKDVF